MTIEVRGDQEALLKAKAEARGVSAEQYAQEILARELGASATLPDLLADLVGVVDSSRSPGGGHARTPFGDLIAAKLEAQGLRKT